MVAIVAAARGIMADRAFAAPGGGSGGTGGSTGIPEVQAAIAVMQADLTAQFVALEAANVTRQTDMEAVNAAREAALQARIVVLEAANTGRTQSSDALVNTRSDAADAQAAADLTNLQTDLDRNHDLVYNTHQVDPLDTSIRGVVNNVQYLLGDTRPVDSNYGNGAKPIAFWAFNGWNNIVGARVSDLSNLASSISGVRSAVNNIEFVVGDQRVGRESIAYKAHHAWGNINAVSIKVDDVYYYAYNAWDNGAKVQRLLEGACEHLPGC